MNETSNVGFTMRGVDSPDGLGSTINVQAGQPAWHHYAGVWDQATGTRKLYIDGVFSNMVTNNTSQQMSQAKDNRLVIGGRANGTNYGNFFTGNFFDVRIYNTTLTANEIVALTLPTPSGLMSGPGDGKVGLSWTPVPGATYTVVTTNTLTNDVQTDTGITTALYTKTDLTNGTPYLFKVAATKAGVTSEYSAEISQVPAPSSAKDILTFTFGQYGNATINGTEITMFLPATVSLINLAPIYTASLLASGVPASGTSFNFTTPQTYTITADDGTTKTYTVTVYLVNPVIYDFSGNSLQGWTQIWPTPPGGLMDSNAMGSGYDAADTRAARSPEFYLVGVGPLTYRLMGGQSPLAAVSVAPNAIPQLAINNGGFAGVALRDVLANTYVLSKTRNGSDGIWQQGQFTAAELAPFSNNGKKYTLDYIDYNKGTWGWTYLDDVSIPGLAALPGSEAQITSKQ